MLIETEKCNSGSIKLVKGALSNALSEETQKIYDFNIFYV